MDDFLAPDTVLGSRYRIVRRLGGGGMGMVYEAIQSGLGRHVAIKVLHRRFARDGKLVMRFKREAETTARLGHPNIVQVTDFHFSPEEGAYLVMELLTGENLETRLNQGPLEVEEARSVAIQIASALEAAHAHGIVHRDLKPGNVFLSHVGGVGNVVKLLDFGVAKLQQYAGPRLTATGALVGTPRYMSPEQVQGATLDARADIWSLGVVLYEMLAGRPAFPEPTPATVITAVLANEPDPIRAFRAGVPPDLIGVVDKCLQKEAAKRYPSATAAKLGLEAALAEPAPRRRSTPMPEVQNDTVPDTSPSAPPELPQKRYGLAALLLLAPLVGAAVFFGIAMAMGDSEQTSPTPSPEVTATLTPKDAATEVSMNAELPIAAPVPEPRSTLRVPRRSTMTSMTHEHVAPALAEPAETTEPPEEQQPPSNVVHAHEREPPPDMGRLTEVISPTSEGAGRPQVSPSHYRGYAAPTLRMLQTHADRCAVEAGLAWGSPRQRFELDIDADGAVRNATPTGNTHSGFASCMLTRLRAGWQRTPNGTPITLTITYAP